MDELARCKAINKAYEEFFIKLTNDILAEIDKDGWCRLVVSKEQAMKMREDVNRIAKK